MAKPKAKPKSIQEQIERLLSRNRDQLTMYEHWLKEKFLASRQTMSEEEAWTDAKAYADKVNKRRQNIFPVINLAAMRRWKPRGNTYLWGRTIPRPLDK